jgi:hypothetical protein
MYLSYLYVHVSHRQSQEKQTVQTCELDCSSVIKGEQILYEFYTLIGQCHYESSFYVGWREGRKQCMIKWENKRRIWRLEPSISYS